jgi:membrane-bound lytic murein transglycosylase
MIAEPIPYFSQLQYSRSPRDNNEQQNQDYQTRTQLDEVNLAEHDQSLAWSHDDQENDLYRNDRNPKPIQSNPLQKTSSIPSLLSDFEPKHSGEENERFKNNPNITSLIEDIVENTLWNILQEAYHNEFSLTARPRLIALPPKRQSSLLTRANLQQTDSNQISLPTAPLIMTESFD